MWRTITAKQYVDNSDPEGFDEARIVCPDGRTREIWDAGYDDDDSVIVVHTSMPNAFAVTATAPVQVR
ncbi:MAG: hypothetical protein RL291_711 [Pseudomonadota bacterium]